MKFGLFGGAKSKPGDAGDSIGYNEYLDYVRAAERLGFHSAYMVEHHFTGVGQVSASLTMLGHIAALTSRIRLGTAVVVLPWHNPALLAEQVATVDLLSGGRFEFGVGRGYRKEEFHRFNMASEEAPARFEETIAFLKKAWTEEGRFSFEGRFWSFNDIVVEPRPAQRPHPAFWMAAGSPDSIRKAAREGYRLLLDQIGSVQITADRIAIYHEEVERCGRPHDPYAVAVTRALQMLGHESERGLALETRASVLKVIGGLARSPSGEKAMPIAFNAADIAEDDAPLLGTPDEIIEQVGRLRDIGALNILLSDPTGSRDTLAAFSEEVMPNFTQDASEPAAARLTTLAL